MSNMAEKIIKIDRKTFDENYTPIEGFEKLFSDKEGLMYVAEYTSNYVLLKFEGKLEHLQAYKDFGEKLINDLVKKYS